MRSLHLVLLVSVLGTGPLASQATPPLRDSLLVSTEWLAEHLGDPTVVLLQVERAPTAAADEHLPGTRFIPLTAIVVERDRLANELPPVAQLDSVLEAAGASNDSRIIIYGDPLSAARMFFTLDYLGLGDRAALLDGGLPRWKAEGRPLTTAVSPASRGRIDPRLRPELVVDGAWVLERLGDSTVILLDARPPSEYSGQFAGEGVTRPGHIPGAVGLYWRLLLTSPDPAWLKDPAILRRLLGRAGVAGDKRIVTYCRTGVQASYVYFVARYLGYAPRLYDGSYMEWSRRPELPVAGPTQ